MKKLLALLTVTAFAVSVSAQISDSSQFYFQKGMEEKKAKRYLVASSHFTKAIELNPGFIDAHIENGYANNEMRKTVYLSVNPDE